VLDECSLWVMAGASKLQQLLARLLTTAVWAEVCQVVVLCALWCVCKLQWCECVGLVLGLVLVRSCYTLFLA
jgi:hypothetical protein